ncbi:malic enzyme-like NAD(P)-binding protein [Coxiella-like endosymbiont of Rhipicephalus sanguineus]|nr:malic enzyme-like NAD(P)-binding protein [Coxiella-like endosymbiont of Rhipicephalus sanguineus]
MFWLVDRTGLLTELSEDVTPVQQPYLRTKDEIKN